MFPHALDDDTTLRVLTGSDAAIFWTVVQQNRAHLDRWLRWSAQVQSLEDAETFCRRFEQRFESEHGFHASIIHKGELVGGVICHDIQRPSNKSEIGYWLIEGAVGKGLATRSAEAVLNYLFHDVGLHRVEIQCGVENLRSRAIPERLGFVNEGVLRESEWITDRYLDHVVYSMLDREWKARG